MTSAHDSTLVIVHLNGGDAGDSRDALWVDCDCGNADYEWAALVQRGDLAALLNTTGAQLVRIASEWDGSPFGDGNGTVQLVGGVVLASGGSGSRHRHQGGAQSRSEGEVAMERIQEQQARARTMSRHEAACDVHSPDSHQPFPDRSKS